jgi:Viral BACON domain
MRRAMILLLALTLLGGHAAAAPQPAVAGPITPQDTPTALVGGGVSSYTLAAPKIFWHTGVPPCPPAAVAQPAAPYTESISRIATYGSSVRQIYAEGRNCSQGQVLSNVVADADYIYFLTSTALMRLSTNANPGDAPQIVNALVSGYGELANASDRTYYLNYSGNNSYIGYVLKSNNQRVPLTAYGRSASSLSTDGQYVYYIVGGVLYRLKPGVDAGVSIATGVSGYYAEGQRLSFCSISPPNCFFTNNVYVGQGRNVRIYNNNTSTLGAPIYTSSDTTAQVYNLVTDFSHLFVYERVQTTCNLFCNYNDVLYRMGRGGSSPTPINTYAAGISSDTRGLTTDGTYLFWQQGDSIQRLANDASALPQINMRVTGIEVTQGIQNLSNSVGLIKKRRTFVRFYVKSDGAAVPGVTARLSAPALGFGAQVSPVNPVGTTITVRGTPSRNDINQSFLFELPWNWTTQASLSLQAELNPYKVPFEPNYSDNISNITVSFKNSPSLSAEFFRLNYTTGGTTYKPRISKDVLQTYSWIMRAYPIGGAIGQNFKPRLWDVDGSTQLGAWVMRTSPDCAAVYPKVSDRSLCASYYTNGWLKYYRDHGWVPNTNDFYYGMIADGAKFPRGQAIYSKTSVGPSGSGTFGWDNDGSYADWYAGHEMGHSLGRAHPNAGSDNPATNNVTENCGHSRSDPGYPYGNTSSAAAPIGPASGSMEGFDGGDPSFGIAKAVYPSASWNDVMSYCNNQWISDYTYNAMYSYMIAHPSAAAAVQSVAPAVSGDFLSVAGVINPPANTAAFSLLRRLSTVAYQPPITPGAYSIRLLDAGSGVLADYAFTPNPADDGGALGFDQVVTFVAGTRTVQIVAQSGNQVLASRAVSANPPVLSNVALQGAPNPVSGVVTLGWTASDPDGDPLTFDIFYSRDSGTTFQPVKMNATGSSTTIDTAQLGGSGTAILRVVASDGVNTAEASSAPFVMANKPPEPYILTPGDNTHIHYGQLVNFSAMAFDAQDGTVADAGLVWKNAQGATLGVGALISLDNLPVGSNQITLTATNSVGQSASAQVTVIVDDDLNLPGPTLTAGPGQVGWHVGAGTTQAQTADITIGNAGSGALSWTASSDQPWLTLSAAGGDISAGGDPATLTLTANPTGLDSEQPYSANVTLTRPASGNDPGQTIVIPVSLSIGDVLENYEPSAASNLVYLPLIRR